MNTKQIMSKFLRFEKQCSFVATEAGFFNSDVIGIDKKNRLQEFEVKVSWSDFLADFKKSKHELFLGGKPRDLMGHYETINGKIIRHEESQVLQRYIEFIPYKFYFVVTPGLKDKVLTHIENNKYPYGVYVVGEGVFELAKRARVINDQAATDRVKDVIALRMSSEIVGLRDSFLSERNSNQFLQNRIAKFEAALKEINPELQIA